MKIDILSDIHIDFYIKEKNPSNKKMKIQIEKFIKNISSVDNLIGDVLIIAGDLGHFNQQIFVFLELMKENYKEIIVVSGNHDMYLISNNQIDKHKAKSHNRLNELKNICKELNVYFLDGNVVDIDGIKFGGTSSWYELKTPEDIRQWKKVMNDNNYIYDGYSVQPYGLYQSYPQASNNWDPIKFYEEEQEKLKHIQEKGCDIFITHVGLNEPTKEEGMFYEYIGDPNNAFYYTDDIKILKNSNCSIHIHGHTHQNLDYTKEGVRIICHPLGYPEETFNTIKQINFTKE